MTKDNTMKERLSITGIKITGNSFWGKFTYLVNGKPVLKMAFKACKIDTYHRMVLAKPPGPYDLMFIEKGSIQISSESICDGSEGKYAVDTTLDVRYSSGKDERILDDSLGRMVLDSEEKLKAFRIICNKVVGLMH